jgi:hypothetical protein
MLKIKLAALLLTSFSILHAAAVAHAQQGTSPSDMSFVLSGAAAGDDSGSASTTSSSSSTNYVRTVPPPVVNQRNDIGSRPFHSIAVGIKADTLGAGIELATPLARHFNLRSGINAFAFNYPFIIDGVNYDAKLHLKSSQTSVDWFPWRGGFHISPGILYFNNSFSAPSSVPAGQYFELGDQGFINSVDDPVAGTATLVFPRKVAPLLTLGFGNLIPRSGRHFSVPFEIGAAFTGAAQINVTLNGTACTSDGCFAFADNADAQSSLKQEVQKFNNDLAKVPVYPILSLGFAYSF